MKKLIFKKFILDVFKTFIIICISISLIVWVIQAVKFLDYVTEDGHSFKVYFSYTVLNLPKIIHRIFPFVFFISLFYEITRYELKNELLVLWTNGVKKISFINTVIIYSLLITSFQIFLGSYISPLSQDRARDFIRNSNIDFFPSLIKAGKFIDTVSNLTIFIETQNEFGDYQNIFLKDSLDKGKANNENRFQIIYAKRGQLLTKDKKKKFRLFDGKVINNSNGDVTNFSFDRIDFNLDKYASKTTIYPKIQEVSSKELLRCTYYIYKNKIKEFNSSYLTCSKTILSEIIQDLLKRIYKPIYLPLIGLIISLQIINSKENKNYERYKIYIFLITFFLIVISEFSLRFSSNNIYGFIFFISFPILLFSTIYISLITKFKNKL